MIRPLIFREQELLLLWYELNRTVLLAENDKIPPILAQRVTLLLCALSFFFNDTATTELYTLSLHDALPISPEDGARTERKGRVPTCRLQARVQGGGVLQRAHALLQQVPRKPLPPRPRAFSQRRYRVLRGRDRKSTRLNSSHITISYAVFCLK